MARLGRFFRFPLFTQPRLRGMMEKENTPKGDYFLWRKNLSI